MNTDGTPLTDLDGYRVYYGNSSGSYSHKIDVDKVTTYTVDNLTEGLIYYFTVTALNTSGNESAYSNEVTNGSSVMQYMLEINKAGTGTGTVTSSPTGIYCGSVCSGAYNAGTVVTLTVSPDTDCIFTGWSGGCTGTGTCSVTMNSAKKVTATFTLKTYTITASAGTGGTISPSGSVSVNKGAEQTSAVRSEADTSRKLSSASDTNAEATPQLSFTVQVGAFKSASRAEALLKMLSQKGFYKYYTLQSLPPFRCA